MRATTTKTVTILNVYRFKLIARICFIVESSNETDTYNCCFNGDTAHAVCGCDRFVKGHKECYHIDQLRPIAQAYFDSRMPTEVQMNAMCAYYEKEQAIAASYSTAEQRHQAPLNSNKPFNLLRV